MSEAVKEKNLEDSIRAEIEGRTAMWQGISGIISDIRAMVAFARKNFEEIGQQFVDQAKADLASRLDR